VYFVTGIGDCGHTEMDRFPVPLCEMPLFWKIPGKDRVIKVTSGSDLKPLAANLKCLCTGAVEQTRRR